MIVFPNSKINIGLHVTGKRADGYHDIESVFYPIPFCEPLEIIRTEGESIEFKTSGLAIPGDLDSNLIVKAYRLLKSKGYLVKGVKVHLHKVIPMGAGLGGGSADAAYFLKAMNELYGLNLGVEELESLALELGSDCPFFINNVPVYVTGRGEKMSRCDLNLKGCFLVLLNPGIHISTKEAYDHVKIGRSNELKGPLSDFIRNSKINEWKRVVSNAFEEGYEKHYPIINELKDKLYASGADFASMTGSGSSVYGVFKTDPQLNFDYEVWRGRL